jgi:hypothetical protein
MVFTTARRLAAPLLLLPTALCAQQSIESQGAAAYASAPAATAPAPGDAPATAAPAQAAVAASADTTELAPIEVVARRLNEARTGIETQTGASVYTIDAAAISSMPGGDNSLLNQVVLQAPDVAQDSFGQFHVRGEHDGLQYRLNGIILPEGISVFGQSLDPRLVSSMQLITGALPAEYGLRTAGIIDISTKSGAIDPGGAVSIYAGSHGTVQPSIAYGGSNGRLQYFFSGDFLANDLGIESPDGSSTPLHDRTKQYHGFGYLEDVIDDHNRIGLILGDSAAGFQIPDQNGVAPIYSVGGRSAFNSGLLNENQREQTQFGIVSWQLSLDRLDMQTSFTVRNSTLQFTPDPIGDLMFNGIAQQAYKRNIAYDWQTDGAYRLGESHTLRAGLYLQNDTSTSLTGSLVLPADNGLQTGETPENVIDNASRTENIESLYLQDEWKWNESFTLNYGARFDAFTAYTSATQLSPRVNAVWMATTRTTVHAGFSRYLSPPPFELVGSEDMARFLNTTAAPQVTLDDTPKAEHANYTDLGVLQNITQKFTVGLDTYYKLSTDLIDEGQFGAPIILTPFNYRYGRQYGEELSLNYAGDALSAYGNLSWQSAMGRDIDSAQFNFTSQQLAYIADNYIHLDHEQKVTASGGATYRWSDTSVSGDLLLGSGLRADLVVPGGIDIPNGMHLPYYTQVNAGAKHVYHLTGDGTLTVRLDVINLFDREYQIRNGTGVGVGAPQYGPRRGYFIGLSKSI